MILITIYANEIVHFDLSYFLNGSSLDEFSLKQVDLTASIRNILRNYPEGTAVLKE